MNASTLIPWFLFAPGFICAYFLMRTIKSERSAARRGSRACAALTAVLLGSLPSSGDSQWQALATIAFAALAGILELVAATRTRALPEA